MNVPLIVRVTDDSLNIDGPTTWLNLEQEDYPVTSDEASVGDAANMLQLVMSGVSGMQYVMDNCVYVSFIGDKIVIKLNVYVWPSSLDLEYRLTADIGTVGPASRLSQYRSRDVIFNGSASTEIGYIMEHVTYESLMPFYFSDGVKKKAPELTVKGGLAYIDENGYCVYRLKGQAQGYKHTVTMEFHKLADSAPNSITSIENTIIAEWNEEGVEEIQTASLKLTIPDCVADALRVCPDGEYLYDKMKCKYDGSCEGDSLLRVYYNTCTGTAIETEWVEQK